MDTADDIEMLCIETEEYAAKCWAEPGYMYFEYLDRASKLMTRNRVESETIDDPWLELQHYVDYGRKEVGQTIKNDIG